MFCWKCNHEMNVSGKVGFRAVCEKCDSDLHVCKQCKNYSPGKPNDCLIPDTPFIADREKNNLCEDFAPKEGKSSHIKKVSADKFLNLFKDD